MKRFILFLCSLLGIGITSCKELPSKGIIKVLPPKEAQTFLKEDFMQFIDVRTSKEFKKEHIIGAQNIDYLSINFDSEIQKLDKTKPVILYCRSGKRSAKSSKKLLKAGFTEIYDLEGGIMNWKKEGFKLNLSERY